MRADITETWTEQLTDEQRQQLRWLHDHKCMVEAAYVPTHPERNLPEGLLLQVVIDKHALVKERGADVRGLFDRVYLAARALLGHGLE